MDLASIIDHTLLSPTATQDQIDRLCKEAIHFGFCNVCVAGRWVSRAALLTDESSVGVCAVINFPHGNAHERAVTHQAALALADGAEELDTLLPLGDFFDRRYSDVVAALKSISSLGAPMKVILETGLLTPEQIRVACELAEEAGAAFVKTCSGFNGGKATVEAVELMSQTVGSRLGVKASGGIATREVALAMVRAGATRLGTSKSLALFEGVVLAD